MIALDVCHRLGDFSLAYDFESHQRVTGLFGPSGAGKSTLLRIVAGLIHPDRGRVEIAGRRVFDSERGIRVAAHRRRIGYVFQQARLFAHLNVDHNLRFGAWFARHRPTAARFDQIVDMLDIGGLLKRRVAAGRCSPIPRSCCSTSRWPRWTVHARPRCCLISSG